MDRVFKTFDHTADIGLRAFGRTLPEAFVNAARGMFSLITDSRRVRGAISLEIEINAVDQSALLMEWLNELLYRFDAEQFVCKKFLISEFSQTSLKAECRGEKVDRRRHSLKRGIKAATFHKLKIEATPQVYQIEVILDV